MPQGAEFDALRVQHGGLHHDHRAEGDVEVDGKDRELPELVNGALGQRRFRMDFGWHHGLLPRLAAVRCQAFFITGGGFHFPVSASLFGA